MYVHCFQTRDLILMILESLVVKLKMIAVYHLPLLFKQHGAEINYDYKSCDRDGFVFFFVCVFAYSIVLVFFFQVPQ